MSFLKDGVEVTQITWTAPTLNTDGSPITQQLTYNLYIDGVQSLNFPGTLNQDGSYSFPLADVAMMQADGEYTLMLTAVDEDGDESDPSGSLLITRLQRPNSPAAFSAE